jgi:hypothetical protein
VKYPAWDIDDGFERGVQLCSGLLHKFSVDGLALMTGRERSQTVYSCFFRAHGAPRLQLEKNPHAAVFGKLRAESAWNTNAALLPEGSLAGPSYRELQLSLGPVIIFWVICSKRLPR